MIKQCLTLITLYILGINLSFANVERDFGGTIEAEQNGKIIHFPLLKSDIEVNINGDLASVIISQTFANPSRSAMHAKYLFPMNKDSAVYAMTMIIGDEITEAKIQRKEQALKTFNTAKKQGKAAALLSQHRPNMFTQKIANLMPGMPIKIRIKYTQVVPKIDGSYQLVVPLVVGPRYQPAGAGVAPEIIDDGRSFGNIKSTSTSKFGTWELEQLPTYPDVYGLTIPDTIDNERVTIKATINADMNINSVFSETHDIKLSGSRKNKTITLSQNHIIDNADFVLKYRLSGKTNQAGFLSTYDTEKGGYFSLLIEPPAAPKDAQISQREMVFVLDTSGSMYGEPLNASKVFMRHALNNLRAGDYFRIISFNSTATEFSTRPQPATTANINRGIKFVNGLQGGGGTEIAKSITQAFITPPRAGAIRLVTFLTDGYIGNEASIFKQISENIGDARIFAFGVGSSVNRYLLSEMGRRGRGFARFIDPTETSNDAAISFAAKLNAPVLTDISLDFGDLDVEQITPDVIPDLFAGDSIRIQGKFKGSGDHVVRVNGNVRSGKASMPIKVTLADHTTEPKEAIPLIWARSLVADKMRHINTPDRFRTTRKTVQQLKKEIVALGLEHAIVTKWTSFVAVAEKIINKTPEHTKQQNVPLPMVKGVTAKAYPGKSFDKVMSIGSRVAGRTALESSLQEVRQAKMMAAPAAIHMPQAASFSGASAPEPAAIGGIVVLALMGLFMIRRRRD